jgi:hypothetical protein
MLVFLQSATAKPVPGLPQVSIEAKQAARKINETDLLDKLGFGAVADTLVMTMLAVFLGSMLIGVILWALRKSFGAKAEVQLAYNDSERMAFDLVTRKAVAAARIDGLNSQIKAVADSLAKMRG